MRCHLLIFSILTLGSLSCAIPKPIPTLAPVQPTMPDSTTQGGDADISYPGNTYDGYELRVFNKPAQQVEELCVVNDLTVQIVGKTGIIAERLFEGRCEGFCTSASKAAGEKKAAALEDTIRTGRAHPSERDYNMTRCIALPSQIVRSFEHLGEPVLLVESTFLGPHDEKHSRFRILGYRCGDVQVSQSFENPNQAMVEPFSKSTAVPKGEGPNGWSSFSLIAPDHMSDEGKGAKMIEWLEVGLDDDGCAWKIN